MRSDGGTTPGEVAGLNAAEAVTPDMVVEDVSVQVSEALSALLAVTLVSKDAGEESNWAVDREMLPFPLTVCAQMLVEGRPLSKSTHW